LSKCADPLFPRRAVSKAVNNRCKDVPILYSAAKEVVIAENLWHLTNYLPHGSVFGVSNKFLANL
jgi:ABC-type uncharacterized transport system substrate-binding protein